MRPLDWVDRLAGVDTLEPHKLVPEDDHTLYAVGGWTRWPWWARLADLFWAWSRGPIVGVSMIVWYVLRHGKDVRKWGQHSDGFYYPTLGELWDITAAIHDIDLRWSYVSDA